MPTPALVIMDAPPSACYEHILAQDGLSNILDQFSGQAAVRPIHRSAWKVNSPKFVLSKSSRLLERANLETEGVPNTRCQHREGAGDKEVDQPLARVCLRGGPPGSHRAKPTVDREVDRDGQRKEQRCRL